MLKNGLLDSKKILSIYFRFPIIPLTHLNEEVRCEPKNTFSINANKKRI